MARRLSRAKKLNQVEKEGAEALRKLMAKDVAEIPALDRAARIDASLAENTVDGDVMWFVAALTPQQRDYGVQLVNHGGDWQKAADAAGYGPGVKRESIESGEVMEAYLKSIASVLAKAATINGAIVVGRIDRIALRAEQEGNLPVALAGNRALGDVFGIFEKNGATIRTNAEGIQITISGARGKEDDEILDAEFVELLERNGRSDLVMALEPGKEVEVGPDAP